MGQSLFPLLRPAYENSPELAELAFQTRAQAESRDILKQQIEFDDQVTQEISSLRLTDLQVGALESLLSGAGPDVNPKSDPAGTFKPVDPGTEPSQNRSQAQSKKEVVEDEEEEEEGDEEPTRHARPRTILFAVGVGLVATVCMVIFLISDRMNSFEGADRISELLESANSLTGDEFEAVETKAGDLQDWFFLKHGLEHYAVPKQFANVMTVGCRVFKFDGATVAQIMAVSDKEILLYMFPSNDLGIKIRKGKWEIVEDEKWVGGATGINDTCFLVAFKGNKDEMKEYLSNVLR
jgi:hypothetical protein